MMIPPDDRGLTLGDGLFETLLARDGVLRDPDAHLDRLETGCAALGLPAPARGHALGLMTEALAAGGLEQGLAAVRLTLTAGSGGRGLERPARVATRLFATAAAYVRPPAPAIVSTAAVRRNAESPASRLKTLAYIDNVLAREAARALGADEALMLNTRGEVACATAANIFWVTRGRLFTPAVGCGVLPGVVRGAVIAAASALNLTLVEIAAPIAQLREADSIFLTNSLIGIRPVAAWDGRSLAPSRLVEGLAARLD